MKTTFKRYAPGLYVDSTNTYVISRDVEATGAYRALYTIRRLTGFGTCLDGVTIMPDYSHIIESSSWSLADAKKCIIRWNELDAQAAFERVMFSDDYAEKTLEKKKG